MSDFQPQAPYQPSTAAVTRRPFYRRTWVVATAGAAVAFFLGVGAGAGTAPTVSSDAQHQIDAAHAETTRVRAVATQAQTDRDTAQAALTTAQTDLSTRKTALDQREAGLDKREAAVSKKEKAAKASTFAGDGIYLVGTDIKPGTYKADASPGCYYEIDKDLSDGLESIITNDNVDGPVVIQVPASAAAVKVARCAEFHKVG